MSLIMLECVAYCSTTLLPTCAFVCRNETSLVTLELMDTDNERVDQAIYGRDYKLRAHFSRPDGKRALVQEMRFSRYRLVHYVLNQRGWLCYRTNFTWSQNSCSDCGKCECRNEP